MQQSCHIPVLEREVVEYLNATQGGMFLDCTLGGGGHTEAILKASSDATVIAADRDQRAIERASARLAPYGNRVSIVQSCFSEIETHIGETKFNGILADLGISSDQLAEERGFSFNDTGALDMRMGSGGVATAEELINSLSEQELFVVLKKGGVGREARAVARAVIGARPITSPDALARIVAQAAPPQKAGKRVHPATVVFQAIRIAVNRELEELDALLALAPRAIASEGRLVVISFHSLEDKQTVSTMRHWESGETMPALWPGAKPTNRLGRVITRKAVVPQEDEVTANPRARSARLRAFQFQ